MSFKDIQRIERIRALNSKNHDWINKDLYRLMFREDLYLIAYEILKSKAGNMTKGSDGSTIDGFSKTTVKNIIARMKDESFQFNPARRVDIPKANGKTRPLGIASPTEKVVQQLMLIILEAIYDDTFSINSHGFRANRGCHTALKDFRNKWSGVNWIIEGDIKGFFDNISHEILINIIRKKISDERFLNLIRKALNAGYLTFGKRINSIVGTPQGSVVSPILANIYLNVFDKYVEQEIIAKNETGKDKKVHPAKRSALRKYRYRLKRASETDDIELKNNLIAEAKIYKEEADKAPSVIDDGSFIRIKYIRYADDWIIGVNGSRELAEEIRKKCAEYLSSELKLELSFEKTHIRHAKTEVANFLGTLIKVGHDNVKVSTITSKNGIRYKKKVTGWLPHMEAPINKLVKKLAEQRFCDANGSPTAKGYWSKLDDTQIVELYGSVWRGIHNYYTFVDNRSNLRRIQYILLYGCAKTLADKHRSKVSKIFKKHGKNISIKVRNEEGQVIRVVSFPIEPNLKRQPNEFLTGNSEAENGGKLSYFVQLRTRSKLNAPCCICGETHGIEMHHVKHIRKMGTTNKGFTKLMAKINRKQIPVCQPCHNKIHKGTYDGIALKDFKHPYIAVA
ncbi:hypothetical protein M5238_002852 [Vibrio vulnificus]|nr:hypothetical protein [Vibrio vulnificus]